MRDYLYVWHRPQERRLVLSGVEFRDLVPELESAGGVVLLRHRFDDASLHLTTRFEFAAGEEFRQLADDNVYVYGDFSWADFGPEVSLADLPDQSIAELTFFGQLARPLKDVEIPGLENRFLCWGHDDGWWTRLYYREWRDVETLLARLLPQVVSPPLVPQALADLSSGDVARWCRGDRVQPCEATEDIDALRRSL